MTQPDPELTPEQLQAARDLALSMLKADHHAVETDRDLHYRVSDSDRNYTARNGQ